MKKFFLLIFVVPILLWQANGYRSVKVKISSGEIVMPLKDKKRLDYFLRAFIVYHSAGFTLLGNKPLSFECFVKPALKWDLLFLWHAFFPSNLKRYCAWKTWQKYEHLFNKGDVLIWSESSPWIKNGELIVVARKKRVAEVLQENQQDFLSLQHLEIKALFKECLIHDGRLGVLLGYGRTNAWLFYENNRASLKPVFIDELEQLFKNKRAILSFVFGWPNVDMPDIVMYPNFMADINTAETKALKREYLQTRQDILDYYKDKDFLEATLDLLQN